MNLPRKLTFGDYIIIGTIIVASILLPGYASTTLTNPYRSLYSIVNRMEKNVTNIERTLDKIDREQDGWLDRIDEHLDNIEQLLGIRGYNLKNK